MADYIKKVAIVGPTGTAGKVITAALLAGGKHELTALVRSSTNTSSLPSGIATTTTIDYDDPSTIVSALRGQDCLIITMFSRAPVTISMTLVEAAAQARVPWILPNEYGYDVSFSEDVARDTMSTAFKKRVRNRVEELGVSRWIGIACGFWYEFSLVGGAKRFGFDVEGREVTLWDGGDRAITTSTWDQMGRAVASLLALPVRGRHPCVEDWADKFVHFSSFKLTQKDMWTALQKATGTSQADWKVKHVGVEAYHQEARKEMFAGGGEGFSKMLYSRFFFPDKAGQADVHYGLDNEKLGLPVEDLGTCTQHALELSKAGAIPLY